MTVKMKVSCTLVLLAHAAFMTEMCCGIKCYFCQYSTRPGVSYSDANCLENLESDSVLKHDCGQRFKYCLKAYEEGTHNGEPYKSMLRACVEKPLPRPCGVADKPNPNPIIKTVMKSAKGSDSMAVEGKYGKLGACVCTKDLCNDEPGYSVTKGDLDTGGSGGGGGSGSGQDSSKTIKLSCWVLASLLMVAIFQ